MNQKVVIIGAGGHGNVVADIVRANNDIVVGFLDDSEKPGKIADICDYKKYADEGMLFVIAIGNASAREKMGSFDCSWYTAIHPTAVISPKAKIGEGSVVMPNAVVNANAVIGRHCIINTAAVVEHNNIIEDFSHISVGAKLGGTVHIGARTWVGIGATVSNNITVCDDCMLGAGTVVVKDITSPGVYYGVPASGKEKKE